MMKLSKNLTLCGSVLVCGVISPPGLQAGGIQLYELGTPDLGLASAGYAARADDASTLFKNPAGMSRLEGTELQTGLQLLYGSVQFSPSANVSGHLGSGDGGNAIGALPGASLFLVHPLSEKVAVGFGSFSYFGLMEDYDENWVGRYYVQKSALLGMSLMPSVSFKANDWLSLGAGLNAMFGYLDTEVAVNNGIGPDGQLKVKDETWGFGANAGILVQPFKSTRFGLTYLSPVDLDFRDNPSFTGLGPVLGRILDGSRPLDLGMTVPQSVMFSVYHELNPKWALLCNVGWQNWNQFGKVDVGVEAGDTSARTVSLSYQDTWHGALGAQFRPSEPWVLSAGFAYDTSAVDDANRTVSLPMGEAWRFGLGAQYQISREVTLGAAYEFMWCGDMAVDQGADTSLRGRVAGAYEGAWFSFFSLHLTWKI